MRVVRACFPLGSGSHECIAKCMHCSPCLQLLGSFNLIAAVRVDFALMKLWLVCPIFTWLAPCPRYSKYWQRLSRTTLGTSVPLSGLGEGGRKEKNPRFTLNPRWIHLGRWTDGACGRTSCEFQRSAMRNADLASDIFLWILAVFHLCSISGQTRAHTAIAVLIKPKFICIFQFS